MVGTRDVYQYRNMALDCKYIIEFHLTSSIFRPHDIWDWTKCNGEEKRLGERPPRFYPVFFFLHADWSTCQLSERAVCGSGIKTRMLDCVRSDGKSVDLKFCEEVCVLLFPFQSSLVINKSKSSVFRIQTGCCLCTFVCWLGDLGRGRKKNLSLATNSPIKYFSFCFSFSWVWIGSGRWTLPVWWSVPSTASYLIGHLGPSAHKPVD